MLEMLQHRREQAPCYMQPCNGAARCEHVFMFTPRIHAQDMSEGLKSRAAGRMCIVLNVTFEWLRTQSPCVAAGCLGYAGV